MTRTILNCPYRVGDILQTTSTVDPATSWPGTKWERITGRFLLAATDGGAAGGNSNASIAAGNTGGEAAHLLTANESGLRSHDHSFIRPVLYYKAGGLVKWPASGTNAQGSDSDGNHRVNNNGGWDAAASHNNMPPYLAVYMWKRTA